jgi:hypothetical protein
MLLWQVDLRLGVGAVELAPQAFQAGARDATISPPLAAQAALGHRDNNAFLANLLARHT